MAALLALPIASTKGLKESTAVLAVRRAQVRAFAGSSWGWVGSPYTAPVFFLGSVGPRTPRRYFFLDWPSQSERWKFNMTTFEGS